MHGLFNTKKIGKNLNIFSKILVKIQRSPYLYRKAVKTLEFFEEILKIQFKIRNRLGKCEKKQTQANTGNLTN